MTGASTPSPQVLVDGHPDDIIDHTAWVEVTPDVSTPSKAVATLELAFPLEDRAEEEHFVCDGETEWMMPEGEPQPDGSFLIRDTMGDGFIRQDPAEGQWTQAEKSSDPGARKFWVVKLVCGT